MATRRMNKRRTAEVAVAHSNRAGIAAVEFAIVAPVLLTLTLGSIDFGRVFHAYSVVSNAARCGVEYGATHKPGVFDFAAWEDAIRGVVDTEMRNLSGYKVAELSCDITYRSETSGFYTVTVVVSYPHETIVAWPGLAMQSRITHRVSMRRMR